MKFVARIEFEEENDDMAKEVLNQLIEEADSLASIGYSGFGAKGMLLYADGETRVP